jgi:hypothetical protein
MKSSLCLIKGCLTLIIAIIPFTVFAGTDISMQLYKEKKYEEAFQYFNEMAEVGNTQAMYNIGVMYYKGEGVKQDWTKAFAWMSVAGTRSSKEAYKQAAVEILNSLSELEQKAAQELAVELVDRFSEEGVKNSLAPEPLSDEDCTQDVSPIKRSPPDYPVAELRKGRIGTVVSEFTVSPQGYVRDVIVISATSPWFAATTVNALLHWRYSPRVENNRAIPKIGVKTRISYLINSKDTGRLLKRGFVSELNNVREKADAGDAVEQFKYAMMLDQYKEFKSDLKGINLEYQEANKWYLASAVSGLANAQYYLGRNMMEGFGCEIDEKAGTKWIRSAAIGGYSPARRFLAAKMINGPSEQNYREMVKFLKYSVDQDSYYPAKILLAWEYATSLLDDIRNGPMALELLKSEPTDYYDPVRVEETKAAAYAEIGDFTKAVSSQDSALESAKKYGWEIAEMRSRLQSYKDNKPWRGEYYVSISPPPIIENPNESEKVLLKK